MILLEYLFGILFIGYCYFVAIRLKWLFEKIEGQPFWLKPHAKNYHVAAGILFFIISAALLVKFHVGYLLVLLLGEYFLIARPAVKVHERGIMTNAFLARWPDVLQAKRLKATGEIAIATKQHWQRIRLQVPPEKDTAFRKMLAAKGIRIVEEDIEQADTPTPALKENKLRSSPEGNVVGKLA